MESINPNGQDPVNRENAFLLYATFCGDIVRTAAALNVSATTVLRMSDEENWPEQLKPILELKKSTKPGDIERAINRALNFVQAHRARMFLNRVLNRVIGMSDAELEEYLLTGGAGKDGIIPVKRLTTRALADLASALEKCHALTYAALNDSTAERVKRKESDDGIGATDMHLKLAQAFENVRASRTPRAQLFDAQLSTAQEQAAQAVKPQSPLDNDEH